MGIDGKGLPDDQPQPVRAKSAEGKDRVQLGLTALYGLSAALAGAYFWNVALALNLQPGPYPALVIGLLVGITVSLISPQSHTLSHSILAGLLAAIMSSVDSGLCACGSLLTYDIFATIRKTTDERELLRDGRIIMAALLVTCVLVAPLIRHFEGLFHYLLYVWALLAPPVFVCFLFGLYYPRANARAALVTLVVGGALGLVAFAILNLPLLKGIRDSLPGYFQNKLNIGFVSAFVCVLVMLFVSHVTEYTDEDRARARLTRQSGRIPPMTRRETAKYRLFAGCLVLIWMAVLFVFSPLGVGK